MTVADLQPKQPDAMGTIIIVMYGRKPPEYAVYRTADRVLVHFADAEDVACVQRKSLARLNPLRGEINGLVDGWRASKNPRKAGKAERYDRRVGDALVVAFEDDVAGAETLLKEIKQDVLDERTATARFWYLVAAFVVAVVSMFLVGAVMRCESMRPGMDLFRAAMTGAVGAFFSISLAIRGRTVLPDLRWVSNVMDAVLRVIIGVVGAAVLMGLVTAQLVNIAIADQSISDGTANNHWLFVLIVGFIAGFSERLVPDLLAKAAATTAPTATKPTTPSSPALPATPPSSVTDRPSGANGKPAEDSLPEEAAVDTCTVAVELPADQLTPDVELPPASGGVAKSNAA